MARPVNIKPTGKGERPDGRKHLNASLPQQLVFDFNEVAKRHGHGKRDALVEDLLRRFLETVEPASKSLQEPPSSDVDAKAITFSPREGEGFRRRLTEREAIRIVREHAEEIIQATSDFATRKPPKRATRSSKGAQKRSAS